MKEDIFLIRERIKINENYRENSKKYQRFFLYRKIGCERLEEERRMEEEHRNKD